MDIDRTRFGPAGYPLDAPKEEAFTYLRSIGLDGMEYQAVRSVPKNKELLKWIREQSEENGVMLSLHAPYAINLASEDPKKREASIERILSAAVAAHRMGARHITFHPGYYGKFGRDEALKIAINSLERLNSVIKGRGLQVELGPETTGKPSQLGSLDDVLAMAESVDGVVPTVDFAHIHVRDGGVIKGRKDYERILDEIEGRLGTLDGLIVHFTEVEPTKSGYGERMHHELGSGYGPEFEPLAQLMVEKDVRWLVISESPLLERDALKMKLVYERLRRKR
ncbi:MAG: TIM barrel protein [Candidatus Korarchaeota archaeon]|nr:TIM barrel protein [Candidatus Korarchaeota archaeon]